MLFSNHGKTDVNCEAGHTLPSTFIVSVKPNFKQTMKENNEIKVRKNIKKILA